MFSGIVQGLCPVTGVIKRDGLLRLTVDLSPFDQELKRGASVAIFGACLTVVAIDGSCATFDVMQESLDKTMLGSLHVGDLVNVERSLHVGDEIGGHAVSGHVTGVALIERVDAAEGSHVVTIAHDPAWSEYLFPKGFVAVDGCSLTIVDVSPGHFTIHLIPETLERTAFGTKKSGDPVHIELDAMTRATVDTVKRVLENRSIESVFS